MRLKEIWNDGMGRRVAGGGGSGCDSLSCGYRVGRVAAWGCEGTGLGDGGQVLVVLRGRVGQPGMVRVVTRLGQRGQTGRVLTSKLEWR